MILQRFIIPLLLLIGTAAFGQKKKPVIRYKTIYDKEFSIGDRIDMGVVNVVVWAADKDSVAIPDSLDLYRHFVQHNPLMTFKLHMLWKNQGVKYPGRTDRTREALLTYFNDDGSEQDSVCDIYQAKHVFVKQEPLLRIEIEIVDIKSPNLEGLLWNGTIGMPEMNVLYRNYDNRIEIAAGGLYDSWQLMGNGVALSSAGERGHYIARTAGKDKSATITLRTLKGADTVALATYTYRVCNLPLPALYFGALRMETIGSVSEEHFLAMSVIVAKYPAEVPINATFEVGETVFSIAGKSYVSQGKLLSGEVKQAYEQADTGAEFVIESVTINGPTGKQTIVGPYRRIKQSPKGSRFTNPVPLDMKCEG